MVTRLTDALAAAQQTAVAAQALHAGTIQQQLVAGEGEELQQERKDVIYSRKWYCFRAFRAVRRYRGGLLSLAALRELGIDPTPPPVTK